MTETERPVKRSVIVSGHATSLSLEAEFWQVLKHIAAERGLTFSALVTEIDASRGGRNLSSAARVYALDYCLQRVPSNRFQLAGSRPKFGDPP